MKTPRLLLAFHTSEGQTAKVADHIAERLAGSDVYVDVVAAEAAPSPDDYDGGTLETNADGIVRQASRAIGSALMFPSFVLHRVAPVTRGERYSLTLWSHGPAFR